MIARGIWLLYYIEHYILESDRHMGEKLTCNNAERNFLQAFRAPLFLKISILAKVKQNLNKLANFLNLKNLGILPFCKILFFFFRIMGYCTYKPIPSSLTNFFILWFHTLSNHCSTRGTFLGSPEIADSSLEVEYFLSKIWTCTHYLSINIPPKFQSIRSVNF